MDEPGCTLGAEGLPERMAEWSALFGRALAGREMTEEGFALHFEAHDGVADELRRLSDLEADCCASLEFRVREADTGVTLEVTGPWEETPWRMAMPVEMST